MRETLILLRGLAKVAVCPLLMALLPMVLLALNPNPQSTLVYVLVGGDLIILCCLNGLFVSGLRDVECANGRF